MFVVNVISDLLTCQLMGHATTSSENEDIFVNRKEADSNNTVFSVRTTC